jgi:DNA-binding XRE family transcriptional regulator
VKSQEITDLLDKGEALDPDSSETKRELGKLVREIRQALGYRPSEFNVRLGVSRQTLDNWESGAVTPKLWLIRSKLTELLPATDAVDLVDRLGILFTDDWIQLLRVKTSYDVWIFKSAPFFEGLPQQDKLREFVWGKLRDGCNFHYVFAEKSQAEVTFNNFAAQTQKKKNLKLGAKLTCYRVHDLKLATEIRLPAPEKQGEAPCGWLAVQYGDEEFERGGRSVLQTRWDVFVGQSVAEYFDKGKTRQKEDGQICWLQLPSSHVAIWRDRIAQVEKAPSRQVDTKQIMPTKIS